MGSTSSGNDLAPEELQINATAAPPNIAPDGVQATEFGSQPVQHGTDDGEGQTRGFRRHDPASGSTEATDAEARADTKEEEHLPTNEIRDDISISSHEIRLQRDQQAYDFRNPPMESLSAKYKSHGAKYARVAAIYTEGLEHRVSEIEKELLELQYESGSKERPDQERRVIYSVLIPR